MLIELAQTQIYFLACDANCRLVSESDLLILIVNEVAYVEPSYRYQFLYTRISTPSENILYVIGQRNRTQLFLLFSVSKPSRFRRLHLHI